jgi:hypothetical protein
VRAFFGQAAERECFEQREMEVMCLLHPRHNDRPILKLQLQAISMQYAGAEVRLEGLEGNVMF